ncbi:hypothetical protein ABBQ38_008572 [Trebouxia sp. C0009 RCD-2024]
MWPIIHRCRAPSGSESSTQVDPSSPIPVWRSDVHTTDASTSEFAHQTSLVDDETDADTKAADNGQKETSLVHSLDEVVARSARLEATTASLRQDVDQVY